MIQANQTNVAYYMLTEEQLCSLGHEIARNVLTDREVSLNERHDRNDELRPIAYWVDRLSLDLSTLWRWEKKGIVRPHRIGRNLFYRESDFLNVPTTKKK